MAFASLVRGAGCSLGVLIAAASTCLACATGGDDQASTGSDAGNDASIAPPHDAAPPPRDSSSGTDASDGSSNDGSNPLDAGGLDAATGCDGGVGCFVYTPSNFNPGSYTPPAGATTDCNATYDSSAHAFTTGSCTGTAPTIY